MNTKNYKSYQLAAKLSPLEWKQFVREVKNGARTGHSPTQALVAAMSDSYPGFDLLDSVLRQELVPGKVLEEAQLRVLRANVKALLETFIVEQALAREPRLRNLLLAQGLTARGAYPAAHAAMRKSTKAKNKKLEVRQLEYDYRFHDLRLDLFVRERQRLSAFGWGELLRALDDFHLARKLCLLCAMVSSYGHLSPAEGEKPYDLEAMLAEVAALGDAVNPLAAIYYRLLSLYLEKCRDEHVPQLKQLLDQHGPDLEGAERINIFALQINLFLNEDIKGIPGSIERVLDVYKQMMDKDILFGLGSFSVNSARNIITVGARIGEMEWTRKFLEEARLRLPQPEGDNIYYYGSGYLHFKEGNYGASRRSLVNLTFVDSFYKLGHDFLHLRISYESRDVDMFSVSHSNLSRYLYRKDGTIAENIRTGVRNLLRVSERMFAMQGQRVDPAALLGLREMVGGFEKLILRDWVLEKLAELEQGRGDK